MGLISRVSSRTYRKFMSHLEMSAKQLWIERIVDHWPKKGKIVKYLCRWHGNGPEDDTWETANLKEKEVPILIRDYTAQLQTPDAQKTPKKPKSRAKAITSKSKLLKTSTKLKAGKATQASSKKTTNSSKHILSKSKKRPRPTAKSKKQTESTIEIRTKKRGTFSIDLHNIRIRGHGLPPGEENKNKMGILLKDMASSEKFWMILDDSKPSLDMQHLLKNHVEKYTSNSYEAARRQLDLPNVPKTKCYPEWPFNDAP